MSLPKLINTKELTRFFGVSRATIYRWMDKESFPVPIKLTSNNVAWIEDEVEKWIDSRPRTTGINRNHDELLNKVFK